MKIPIPWQFERYESAEQTAKLVAFYANYRFHLLHTLPLRTVREMPIVTRMTGHRIVEMRDKRGWTQEDLGTRISRTKWQISRLESGKTRLDLDTARKLARAFGVPLSDLVGAATENPAPAAPATAGMAEEMVPYTPAANDPMSAFLAPARGLFRIDSDSLDKIALKRGDVVVSMALDARSYVRRWPWVFPG